MTICVSVKVSEGLVLAADSLAAVQGVMAIGTQQVQGLLKTFDFGRKLSHFKDYPIGTLTWGTYIIGSRSVLSLIKEHEYRVASLGEELEKIKDRRMRGEASVDAVPQYSVRKIAEAIFAHVKSAYDQEFSAKPQSPPLGILVSGYSSGSFFPEQWLIDLPHSSDLTEVRPDINGVPDFGANWFGLTDAIVRLHWGRDDALFDLLKSKVKIPEAELRSILDCRQYHVLFNGMPLQDAIEYAAYIANVSIGRFRFVTGPPLCGGEIDLAVITPNAFNWVRRKAWKI
jgi:hypothetical protein